MKFSQVERLQLEAMGYKVTMEHGNEIARFAVGSISNYYRDVIHARHVCVGYENEVYHLSEYEDFSESGSPSDHDIEGSRYVNINNMYKEHKLAEEARRARREKWEQVRRRRG